jgi:plastocyanin
MKPGVTALAACCALALAAGCGSSSSSTGSSSTPATASTASTSSSGLKANTTPKFASPAASAQAQSGIVQIAYRNIAIDPDTVKVKLGSTIKWTNHDAVEHNVTSQGSGPQKFASKDFGESGTFEIKANKPGVIHYLCTIHPASMNGTIEVLK